MILYRAVSQAEWKDYIEFGAFRTAKNTLEAKQFFRSEAGIIDFVERSKERHSNPPYLFIIQVDIDESCL